MATNSMCDNKCGDEDCELVFVQDDAKRDEDYYDEYEDNRCKDYEDYGEVDSDREGEKRLTWRWQMLIATTEEWKSK